MHMSVVSQFRRKHLADRLRARIGDMFLDGTVSRIAQRYPVESSRTAQSLAAQANTEYQRRMLQNTRLAAALVICVLIAALTWSLRATRHERSARDEARRLSGQILRVQDEERRRMARDLHDGVAQQVAAIGINLTMVKSLIETADTQEAIRLIEDNRQLATNCGRELRSTTYLLHPPVLEELGLEPAIRSFAEGFTRRSGVRVELDIEEGLGRLPPDIEAALFRIMQEALANVQRHSGSPSARISLRRQNGEVELLVRDYGSGGTEAPGGRELGVGIRGMEERVRQFGGRFEVRFGQDGTRVRSVLPA
jgi:signal transduction histidine kinase